MRCHVAFTPAESVSAPLGIVVDVMRATSTIVQALASGYRRVLCCAAIDDALALREELGAEAITGGEREAKRIDAFDAGASPREFLEPRAETLILSTTNGTRAIVAAAASCSEVVLGALLNLDAVARHARERGEDAVVLCAGYKDAGFAVDPAAPGCAYFETRGVERLYGGLEPALKRALASVGPGWDARVGAAGRRFAALAAANVARSGQALVVSDERTREFLAPLPLTLLPVDAARRQELEDLGVKKLGELAGLPGGAVAERLGPDGRRAWSLARGGSSGRVRGRRPVAELTETLEFPEAVGNELTLRRAPRVLPA